MAKFKISYFLWFLDDFSTSRIMYNNLKADNYSKTHTTLFGRKALKSIILFAIMLSLSLLLASWLKTAYLNGKVLSMILSIVLLITIVPNAVLCLPVAINLIIKQLLLNKKFIGFFNLILFVCLLIASVIFIITIL